MKFDQDLCKNLRYDLWKLLWYEHSTVRSVVPLAMFFNLEIWDSQTGRHEDLEMGKALDYNGASFKPFVICLLIESQVRNSRFVRLQFL